MLSRRSFLAAAGALASRAGRADTLGPGMIYAGALQSRILLIDEAKEKIVGEIPLKTGVPRGLRFSYDRKKFYVNTPKDNGFEIVDIAARKVEHHFVLNEANRRVQLQGYAPDPQDKLLYGRIRVSIKQVDRFELEKPKFAVIDIAQGKIIKTVDVPETEGKPINTGNFRVTPDGKFLYSFAGDVRIFDTSDFKQVETIELSKPLYPGMATIGFGPRDDWEDSDQNVVVGVFNSTDPIVRRSIAGLARFDLVKRTFEFTPVGPAADAGMFGLQLTPDRKIGYTVSFHGSLGNQRGEFWVFDMNSKKVVKRVEIPPPPGFGFVLSGDAKRIYMPAPLPSWRVFDAETLQPRKSIEVNADTTTRPLVIPSRTA